MTKFNKDEDVCVDMIGRIVKLKKSARGEEFAVIKSFTRLGTPYTARVPISMVYPLNKGEER